MLIKLDTELKKFDGKSYTYQDEATVKDPNTGEDVKGIIAKPLTARMAFCTILQHPYEDEKKMSKVEAMKRDILSRELYSAKDYDFNTDQVSMLNTLIEKATGTLYALGVCCELFRILEVGKSEAKPDLKLTENEKKD